MEPSTVTDVELEALQATAVHLICVAAVNRAHGLIRDKTEPGAPASIAVLGMALSTAPALVEQGVRPRDFMAGLVLRTSRFFANSPQGIEAEATGYKGEPRTSPHAKPGSGLSTAKANSPRIPEAHCTPIPQLR
jgi:hypothetical protein